MANLTDSDILHIANLAKISLTKDEIKKFGGQLAKIIEFISHLSEVDVKNVEPTAQVTGLENVYREDVVSSENILSQDEALSGTDDIHDGYFKVKAILTERSDK